LEEPVQRLPLILANVVLFTGLLASPGVSQERDPQRSAPATHEEKQVKAILDAKGPHHAAASYRALFKSVKSEGLRRLQMNSSDTIAIQAAWEELELTIPTNPDRVVRPDRDKLARFLGFLEGRARVQAPQWWTDAVLDARANRRGNVYAGGLSMSEDREGKDKAAMPPPLATFDRQDGKAVVRVNSNSAPIPDDLREKLRMDGLKDSLTALMTRRHCYVAAYDSVGYPYELACLDRSSGKIRWLANVWASWWGGATGHHSQWVEVTEQGDRVVVFGVASVGFHAEGFRVEDGVNLFRFSNSYSGR
jgi:hypothetical protein